MSNPIWSKPFAPSHPLAQSRRTGEGMLSPGRASARATIRSGADRRQGWQAAAAPSIMRTTTKPAEVSSTRPRALRCRRITHPEGRRSSLELDRHFIERNDFSAARRGYDPDEVDRHLREIADAVAELKRSAKRSPSTIAAQAAEQVRGIVEAAERSASDIQEQAEGEAKRITDDAGTRARETRERADADAVDRVRKAEEATETMLTRANGVESEIDRLLGEMRSAATSLVEHIRSGTTSLDSELTAIRTEFESVREDRLEPVPSGG